MLTHSLNVQAVFSFTLWQDEIRTMNCDPLPWLEPIPKAWQSRTRQVWLDPESAPYDIFAQELTITGSQSLQHLRSRRARPRRRRVWLRSPGHRRLPLPAIEKAIDLVRRGEVVKTWSA
ncbi:hypothetical protein ACFVX3_18155 [Rhodococcus erythropolis]